MVRVKDLLPASIESLANTNDKRLAALENLKSLGKFITETQKQEKRQG